MRYLATVEQTRAADASASARVGEGTLIARAAAAVATAAGGMLGRVYGAPVAVLAGSGHNGADALQAAQLLAARGAAVRVVRSSERAGDALWAAGLQGLRVVDTVPDVTALVLDGMVGVGARGALHGRAAELAAGLDPAVPVLAVDIASGVDADTGAVEGQAVRAMVTVTFDRLKPGHVLGAGAEHAGSLVVAGIGLDYPRALLLALPDADDIAGLMPTPGPTSDKYSRGVVGVVAGSERYPGAAVLCTGGAIHAGAGYLRYEGGAPDAVRAAWPTAVVGDGRVDAYVCGSGLEGEHGLDAARRVVAADTAAVLDAGALQLGADALRGRRAPTIITPHLGEFRRLTEGMSLPDPASDPLGAARAAAADLGVHVLLKGGHTVVAAPDGRALINSTGTTWLSTAGTGDVLAGALGALLAAAVKRGAPDLLLVAAGGAFLHGLAGRYAPVPLHATDLLVAWPEAVAAVRR